MFTGAAVALLSALGFSALGAVWYLIVKRRRPSYTEAFSAGVLMIFVAVIILYAFVIAKDFINP